MVIRICLGKGRKLQKRPQKNQHVALALAALLTPAAVMALVLAIWPLAADLKFTGAFPIDAGVFSHWQVWLALGCSLQCIAIVLNRYGKPKVTFNEPLDSRERQLANSRF
jgi:hypothetical protein